MNTGRVEFNRSLEERRDTYGNVWAPRTARVRMSPCTCRVPCAIYLCSDCGKRRPWCRGGHPDPRCDFCVVGMREPARTS